MPNIDLAGGAARAKPRTKWKKQGIRVSFKQGQRGNFLSQSQKKPLYGGSFIRKHPKRVHFKVGKARNSQIFCAEGTQRVCSQDS